MRKVLVRISKKGQVSVETQGFVGQECRTAEWANHLISGLGRTIADVETQEASLTATQELEAH